MGRIMGGRAVAVLVLSLSIGCASADSDDHPCNGSCIFFPGDDNDPVVRMALTATPTDTVQFTFKNTTAYEFSPGLITFSQLFTPGTKVSSALSSFVTLGATNWGNPLALASALGLSIGTNAFSTPKVPAGATATMTVQVARGTTLYYVAAVTGAVDDFVGLGPVDTSTGSTATMKITGYDPNDGKKGTIVVGNGTTGASPAGTTVASTNLTIDCAAGIVTSALNLLTDNFSSGTGSLLWPANVGYAGDFNAEWVSDGVAQAINPTWAWAAPGAPQLPIVTGFVKFLDVCPTASAAVSVSADVVTKYYTDATSDATLVVYYFDKNNAVISVDTTLPLHGGNERKTALYTSSIPTGTRRIAIAPMAYLGPTETSTIYYDNMQVDYAPSVSGTVLYSDDFSSYGASTYGANQPTGWADFGSDWFVHPTFKFATVWNNQWGGGGLPPYETGMFKDVSLVGKYSAGQTLSARLFASSTFSSANSFALLRLVFNTGKTVDSDRLQGAAWANLDLRDVAIPTGATSVRVIVIADLAAGETSSMYVDDLSLTVR